jgi:hypothetical protein
VFTERGNRAEFGCTLLREDRRSRQRHLSRRDGDRNPAQSGLTLKCRHIIDETKRGVGCTQSLGGRAAIEAREGFSDQASTAARLQTTLLSTICQSGDQLLRNIDPIVGAA